jgi:hypothetical protein
MIQTITKLLVPCMLCACPLIARAQGLPPAEAGSPAERLAPETNPAVRAALELPRTEPKHYLEAVLALIDLQRPELAAPILQELIALNLSDEQRAELVRDFGSHRLLQLARTTALAPASGEFAEACMAAAEKLARDPERMARLIEQLAAPSPDVRHMARLALDAAGEEGIVATLEALARENDPQRRAALRDAIVQMSPEAVGPLLGMLNTSDGQLQLDVIRLLEAMRVMQAMPLVAAATASPDAERLLTNALDRYRRGTRAFAADNNGEVVLWDWDAPAEKLGYLCYSADEAQTIWMARLAFALAQLRPENLAYRRQALLLGFDAAIPPRGGADSRTSATRPDEQAFHAMAASADVALLNSVLADALKQHRSRAAIRAAELLGEREDAGILYSRTPEPAPLAAALDYPDRRVRFAALEAIMRLDPQSPFPGDSRVPSALGYFATGANERRAMVAMPIAGQATTLAGRLSGLGVEAEAATRGAPAVRLVQRSADLEFVLVDVDIDGPGIRDVLYALRTNAATGRIPIGLLATGERWDTAQRLAGEHSRIVAFPRPQSDAALAELVDRLTAISDRDAISASDRAEMAARALGWLGNLLTRPGTFYDLRQQAPVIEAALYLPHMTESSIASLALLGTPSSQRALVDFASQRELPVEPRKQAVAAFAASVAANGILLTEEEILRQYNRYNASASADADTQQVLGTILDTLESRRADSLNRREDEAPAEPLRPAPGSAGASPSLTVPETAF